MICAIPTGTLKNQSGSGNIHYYPYSGGDRESTLKESMKVYMPMAGTIEEIYVVLDSATVSGSFVLELLKNGVSVATITIATSGTSGSATGLGISVATTDYLTWRTTNNGNAARLANAVSYFVPTTAHVSPIVCMPTTFSQNGAFIAPRGTSGSSTTRSTREWVVPKSGILERLFIHTDVTPTAAKTRSITIVKNGVDTALAATITSGNLVASDTSNQVSVVAGDLIAFKCGDSNTFPASPYLGITMQWTPDDGVGTIYPEHTTSGPSSDGAPDFLSHGGDNVSDNNVLTADTLNSGGGFGGQCSRIMLGPSIGALLTGIYVKVSAAPSAGQTLTYLGRKNGSTDLGVTGQITSAGASALDFSHNDQFNATDTFSIKRTTAGGNPSFVETMMTLQFSGSTLNRTAGRTAILKGIGRGHVRGVH